MTFLAGFAAFLDYRYWINQNPVPLGPSLVSGILMFFGWFLVAAVVLYLVARYFRKSAPLKKDVFQRFGRLMLNVGVIGLLILFFSYQQAPFLGMRLWFLLLFIYLVVRLSLLIVYVIRDYPQKVAEIVERERRTKYFPKKKRK
jgi:hypothetical protein